MLNCVTEAFAALPALSTVPSGSRAATMSGTKGRVLVIDDDQSMCETLSSALARRNFSVVWSTVGREALALLDHGDFDVVLTDLNMEDLSGLALA